MYENIKKKTFLVPRLYFFMFNTAEHEILNPHKYKISRNSVFLILRLVRMLLFLRMNVKMPTTVGISTFLSR